MCVSVQQKSDLFSTTDFALLFEEEKKLEIHYGPAGLGLVMMMKSQRRLQKQCAIIMTKMM